ncbi:MAG: DoxX family protein [Candidatus Neomarinimicrobiota bacterium]|nr:DoxX family protein [Candidatus Neomarinimicrobiota bacterium]
MSITVISFCHVYFGFLAALSEGVCPILICIGIATRFSAMMLTLTMLFDGGYHLSNGENLESAFVYLAVYLTLFFAGPGKFSFDQQFLK